jgi:G3E family GTPase
LISPPRARTARLRDERPPRARARAAPAAAAAGAGAVGRAVAALLPAARAADRERQPGAISPICPISSVCAALHDRASIWPQAAGELELDAFNGWVGALLQQQGEQLLRVKGILAVRGYRRKFVFHGAARAHPRDSSSAGFPLVHTFQPAPSSLMCAAVHMIFEGASGSEWPADQPRSSRLVIIGRGLQRAGLLRGFRGCEVYACRPAEEVEESKKD